MIAKVSQNANGHFTPPDAPGHGIVFNRVVLAAHTVDA